MSALKQPGSPELGSLDMSFCVPVDAGKWLAQRISYISTYVPSLLDIASQTHVRWWSMYAVSLTLLMRVTKHDVK